MVPFNPYAEYLSRPADWHHVWTKLEYLIKESELEDELNLASVISEGPILSERYSFL